MAQSPQANPGMSLGALAKADELRNRLLFTLGALIVYRLGTFIPLPGIDPVALSDVFGQQSSGILGMFDMFSGGALGRMTIFALNIMPYITASIIMQLMTAIVPSLETMKKDGEAGRKQINQYTRYLTVLLATFQGFGIAVALESAGNIVADPGMFFRLTTVVTLVGGTLFLMWLGEQITSRGIGNGISLIIFSGIVAEVPSALIGTLELGRTGALSAGLIVGVFVMAIAVIAFIVFIERSVRRILIQYPKRQHGNKVFGGDAQYLPLKINVPGVIPPIFASSLLLMPVSIINLTGGQSGGADWLVTLNALLGRGQPLYLAIYIGLIVFFAFFYTAIVFNPEDTADNLRKNGGYIPGIRPGQPTADYLDYILTRLTVLGAAYLSAVCILPEILISQYAVPFYLGGTSLLIVVTVTLDTVSQVQSHMLAHQYEGLIKKSRLKGRR
ncbi:MAG: preprotein translocase subunit SecY [Alphaproteobacteria bacterium]|jgi:preprotein translocase subunit SecY|nr:preprotein translocase subunit SecY [Alphaproteobacteria bacterium]MBT5481273.1 preprotein translocase subunit SecY [Alphaproteobacteria bacterium]MBT5728014.1 preprotein translocase subunit SecY [Alphaproteobacteria bacterium]MDG1030699.1 preprotein translocase subunit SecY [Alphaproteobacteria bacterium]HAD72895.1 preprotein translocase subunit SecY [Alphaproteobacteria bacterium]